MTAWAVDDPRRFLDENLRSLFDHAQPEFIVSSHLMKILAAVQDELGAAPDAPFAPLLLAATNRFLNAPLKRRHILRSAKQALDFVGIED